jgi:hypothetical protein
MSIQVLNSTNSHRNLVIGELSAIGFQDSLDSLPRLRPGQGFGWNDKDGVSAPSLNLSHLFGFAHDRLWGEKITRLTPTMTYLFAIAFVIICARGNTAGQFSLTPLTMPQDWHREFSGARRTEFGAKGPTTG